MDFLSVPGRLYSFRAQHGKFDPSLILYVQYNVCVCVPVVLSVISIIIYVVPCCINLPFSKKNTHFERE